MRYPLRPVLLCLLGSLALLLFADEAAAERPAHFSYPTKLMNVETAYMLGEEGGRIKVGLGESGYGFHPRVNVTTNTMLDVISFLNARLKLALLFEDGKRPAISVGGGYYNLVASGWVVKRIAEEALSTEDDFDLDSGLESWYMHISVSKQLHERARFHLSYQYRYISGYFESDEPITLTSGGEELSAFASLDQSVYQRSVMSALDADLGSSLKVMLEMGYDTSYEKFRGGIGLRLAATRSFAIQGGVLWPGVDLGDDFDSPVVPNLAFFWRY